MKNLLIKHETAYGMDLPAPGFSKLMLEAGFRPADDRLQGVSYKGFLSTIGRLDMVKQKADRIPRNRPMWVSIGPPGHPNAGPDRVLVYYRRTLRDGHVRLYFRAASVPSVVLSPR